MAQTNPYGGPHELACSVTRFSAISPIWQNLQYWAIFEGLFPIWKNFGPTLANFVCHWASFHGCKLPKVGKLSSHNGHTAVACHFYTNVSEANFQFYSQIKTRASKEEDGSSWDEDDDDDDGDDDGENILNLSERDQCDQMLKL